MTHPHHSPRNSDDDPDDHVPPRSFEPWDALDTWPADDLDLEMDDEPQPEPGDFWLDDDDDEDDYD